MIRLGPAALLLAALASCVSAYQPGTVDLPVPMPDGTFERVLHIVQLYYSEVEVDRERFFIKSSWHPCDDRGQPAQRRLTLFLDEPGVLAVIVEARYLQVPLIGDPSWTPLRGHRRWEDELIKALEQALGS